MNASPLVYSDPNGDIPPLVFVGAALIGGGLNLYSNWGSVQSLWDGLGYFASGAGGGAVSVVNPVAGGLLTGIGNLSTDFSNGTLANLNTPREIIGHLAGTVLEGLGAGSSGALAKGGFNLLQKSGWTNFNEFVYLSDADVALTFATTGSNPSVSYTVQTINAKVTTSQIVKATTSTVANSTVGGGSNLWRVGQYNRLKGLQAGLDAHHVGQKALMKKLISNYNWRTGPSILIPKSGHTLRSSAGIVKRSTKGIQSARDLLARDIKELRRVYPNIPNNALQELIQLNKQMYPNAFLK